MRALIALLLTFAAVMTANAAGTDPVFVITNTSIDYVDLGSGAYTTVAALPLPVGLVGSIAYDAAGHRLLYIARSGTSRTLVSVSMETFVATTTALPPGPLIAAVQYDPVDGVLYGLEDSPGVPVVTVTLSGSVSVFTATPAGTQVNFVIPSAIDPIHRRYYYMSDPLGVSKTLHTVDLTSGIVTSLPLSFVGGYASLELDPRNSHLLATRIQGGHTEVVDLDPASGSTTHIATAVNRLLGRMFTYFDPAKGLWYLASFPPDAYTLDTIDVTTGVLVGFLYVDNGVAAIVPIPTGPAIPTLEPRMLALLFVALTGIAFVALQRR